ncbi:pilus assembly protein TadB [Saccharopolyspora sp. NPDC050389]|uniref:type II secretion system F family protein n=1 Tax=Saccharopolyspora sp. NPDC050389 TaxID=3155516 RepID=UPI0034082128
MTTILVVLAAVLGVGLAVGVRAVAGPAPMDLAAAWHHICTRTPGADPAVGWRAHRRRLLAWLTRRAERTQHRWLALPVRDLNLLDTTPAAYMATRLRWTACSIAAATLFTAAPAAVGMALPLGMSVVIVLAAGVVGAMVPAWRLREQAKAAREDCRRVLAVYLDLVAHERAAGHAPAQALREAAGVGGHWLFLRLHRTLVHAEHSGHSPWDALRDLGDRIGLRDLVAVADLAATAAEGAAIYTSVTAHAARLRSAAVSTDKADANARTERLTLPVTALMLGFLILVLYPTIGRLIAG